jgi:oligopeptide transport system ATP-binding protein
VRANSARTTPISLTIREGILDSILSVKDLVVRFHTLDGTVHAVNGVSFSVGAGQTLGVVGESGCGKSVTMLSIMRLIPQPPGEIASGQVLLHDRDLLKLGKEAMQQVRGKEIAMVFQDPMTSLNPVLTIGRQISESMRVHLGLDAEAARLQAVHLLEMVGIPQAAARYHDYPHQFSGGMRQRVMIAIALACNPAILIADEPTTALDVTIQHQIITLVKELRDRLGMAIIWITHDLGVIAELADQVVVMYAGFIVEQADIYTLFSDPRHPYTLALLKSIPHLDQRDPEKLATIPGSPPDCVNLPPYCPFVPRCAFAISRCKEQNPALKPVADEHQIACWVDIQTGVER